MALSFCLLATSGWTQPSASATTLPAAADALPLALSQFKSIAFGGEGRVTIADDVITLGAGSPLTGARFEGPALPTVDYELSLEAMRVRGSDFFCGLTFPVRESHCTLILGGWGGALVGLSCLDGADASENDTTTHATFPEGQWCRVRVQVSARRITVLIDDIKRIDADIERRVVSLRADVALTKPLAVCSYATSARFKSVRLRRGLAPRAEAAPPTPAHRAVAGLLEAARRASGFPGACAAWVDRDGHSDAVAVGELTTGDRLMSGSIGKTYVAAVTLRLVARGKLDLDATVATYLGDAPWLRHVPNGEATTLRQLMQHTSGIPEHVWQPKFQEAVHANPDRVWTAPELMGFVADQKPMFAPGEGWSYADTNYVLLGAVIEAVVGQPCFEVVRREVLQPLHLEDTAPNEQRAVPGLAGGHTSGLLGFAAGPVVVDGKYPVNPQFEYCGGGMSSTTLDLARWCRALYAGEVVSDALRTQMLDGVPAKTGPRQRYGLGTIVVDSAHGRAFGHTGVMPGYLSIMLFYEDLGLAVAVQFNTDVTKQLGKRLEAHADAVAAAVRGG